METRSDHRSGRGSRWKRCRRGVPLLVLSLCAVITPPSFAVADDSTGPDIAARLDSISDAATNRNLSVIIDAIDDPAFLVREAATDELMRERWSLDQLLDVLATAGDELTPEQRQRLITVAYQRIMNTEFGAMGISMRFQRGQANHAGAVEVTDLIPGMPAERFLEIGDLITHIDGRPLHSNRDLGERVRQKAPGDQVAVRVLRVRRGGNGAVMRFENGSPQYETIDVSFEVVSADNLPRNRQNQFRGGMNTDDIDLRLDAERIVEEYSMSPRYVHFADATVIDRIRTVITQLRDGSNPAVLDDLERLLIESTDTAQAQPVATITEWKTVLSILVGYRNSYDSSERGWAVLNRLAVRCEYLIAVLERVHGPRGL